MGASILCDFEHLPSVPLRASCEESFRHFGQGVSMFRVADRDEHEATRDRLNQTRIANGLEAHYHPRARNEVLGLLALLMFVVVLTLVAT